MQHIMFKPLKKERPLDNQMATKVAVSATTVGRENALYLDIKKHETNKEKNAD